MPLSRWFDTATPLRGAPGAWGRAVSREQWTEAAQAVAAQGGRLLSLWSQEPAGAPMRLMALFLCDRGALLLELAGEGTASGRAGADYPGLQELFPVAQRLQRAVADLSGWHSSDADRRGWLRHAAWPESFHPLQSSAVTHAVSDAPDAPDAPSGADYAFVPVEGEGVHEIAVGPVHAGVIEPGHFRFSVVGEKVLRLEERLGYAHKGIERRFTELPARQAHRLAARISGDSAVAFSWAYCQALEGLCDQPAPQRALWLRALALELERLANHLGDLGALGNDAGFAFALSQFSLLKEQLLRLNEAVFGQRYLFDFIVPGGVRVDIDAAGIEALDGQMSRLAPHVQRLRALLEEHDGVQDRFSGAGTVSVSTARRLGLAGLAGRASGQAFDLRCDLPCAPYDVLGVQRQLRSEGDVAARVALRFDELAESCRLVRQIVTRIPGGEHLVALPEPLAPRFGLGLIEGWRGPTMIALQVGVSGGIERCHPHDVSWQNWPVLEHAVVNDIVADFPLINKSFNSPIAATICERSAREAMSMWKTLQQIRRTGLVSEAAPEPEVTLRLRETLQTRILEVMGRALCVRHVDAGSCNGCELEIQALSNALYNLEGLGIRLVASPRHADLLLVTGPVARHMEAPLRRVYEATADPKLVVAIGDCGCHGGIFDEGYASRGAVANVIPVDVGVPGCPPSPQRILSGILTAISGRSPGSGVRQSGADAPGGLGAVQARGANVSQ